MGKKTPLQEVDPLYLPLGARVGPWRVVEWVGRGVYGSVYRAVREGDEHLVAPRARSIPQPARRTKNAGAHSAHVENRKAAEELESVAVAAVVGTMKIVDRGGGVPVVGALRRGLAGDTIESIRGRSSSRKTLSAS